MSSFQRAREALGFKLRELRLDADLTGRQLAAQAGWAPSKISKIEGGRQTPSDADLRRWAELCRQSDVVPELIASLRSLEQQYVEFRRMFRAGLPSRQRSLAELEARASRTRNFETCFVPGLLQTPEYARYRFLEGEEGDRDRGAPTSEAEIDEAVATRMERQQAIRARDKQFHFVFTEAVLHYQVCPRDVMAGQIGYLVSLTTLPTIRLGIVPFSASLPVGPLNGFCLYDASLVLVELFTASLQITQSDEISAYERVFNDFATTAVYGVDARALLSQTLADQPS